MSSYAAGKARVHWSFACAVRQRAGGSAACPGTRRAKPRVRDQAWPAGRLDTEAVRLLCAHLVDEQGYHRLVIDPDADNAAAIACYAKAGFRPVGVMRQYSLDRHGQWRDGLLMDLLATELVPG